MIEWALPAVDLLSSDERAAVLTLNDGLGFNVFTQPLFWENIIARQFGGTVTHHRSLHDVEVNIWQKDCRLEVKFSRGYIGHFSKIREKDWSRPVFKWASPRGYSGKSSAHAIALIGMENEMIFSWLIPTEKILPNCKSITMTTPSGRIGHKSRWDKYAVPFDVLLPAFARLCHNRYDMPMRRAGMKARAREACACGDLFLPGDG